MPAPQHALCRGAFLTRYDCAFFGRLLHRGLRFGMNAYTSPPASLLAMLTSLWHHRQLIVRLTHREILGRYRGSIMGVLWSLLTPLCMLLIYTFVFSVVFKARWGEGLEQGRGQFAIILFAGLIVHGVFAEVLNRAPQLIVANVNYVKKVVFPLEVLPVVQLLAAGFHALVSVAVLLLAQIFLGPPIPWTALFLPLVALPLLLLTLGLAWFLTSIGVFLRDVSQAIGLLTSVLLFTAPVFFPLHVLPERLQPWLQLNPLTFIIEQTRAVLIWGQWPNFTGLAIYSLCALLTALLGFQWFQKTRKGFADVL